MISARREYISAADPRREEAPRPKPGGKSRCWQHHGGASVESRPVHRTPGLPYALQIGHDHQVHELLEQCRRSRWPHPSVGHAGGGTGFRSSVMPG